MPQGDTALSTWFDTLSVPVSSSAIENTSPTSEVRLENYFLNIQWILPQLPLGQLRDPTPAPGDTTHRQTNLLSEAGVGNIWLKRLQHKISLSRDSSFSGTARGCLATAAAWRDCPELYHIHVACCKTPCFKYLSSGWRLISYKATPLIITSRQGETIPKANEESYWEEEGGGGGGEEEKEEGEDDSTDHRKYQTIQPTPEQWEPNGFCILPSLLAVCYHNSPGTS